MAEDAPPIALVTLLESWLQIFARFKAQSFGQTEHLVNGLKKLEEVHGTVAKLQSTAGEKQVQLEQKQAEAREALQNIKKAMRAAAERKQEVEKLEEVTTKDEQATRTEKA